MNNYCYIQNPYSNRLTDIKENYTIKTFYADTNVVPF